MSARPRRAWSSRRRGRSKSPIPRAPWTRIMWCPLTSGVAARSDSSRTRFRSGAGKLLNDSLPVHLALNGQRAPGRGRLRSSRPHSSGVGDGGNQHFIPRRCFRSCDHFIIEVASSAMALFIFLTVWIAIFVHSCPSFCWRTGGAHSIYVVSLNCTIYIVHVLDMSSLLCDVAFLSGSLPMLMDP